MLKISVHGLTQQLRSPVKRLPTRKLGNFQPHPKPEIVLFDCLCIQIHRNAIWIRELAAQDSKAHIVPGAEIVGKSAPIGLDAARRAG